MLAAERRKIILEKVHEEKKVIVSELSREFEVSEETIRRDLEKLESEGFLQRTHGGAVINNEPQEEIVEDQSDQYLIERQEIADTVFHLVSDNDMIMITEGLTNVQVARRLSEKSNLTVITNDVRIALEFKNSPGNNIILLGGDLNEYGVYGQLAINNMQYFSYNHLFIEVDAISKQTGMMASSISKASLIQKAIQAAENTTIICLAKYFGEKSLYRIGNIETADRIVTNSTLDDSYKDYLFGLNIKVYTSVDIYEE